MSKSRTAASSAAVSRPVSIWNRRLNFFQRRKREIDPQILGEQQPLPLTVFAEVNDAGPEAVLRLGEVHRPAKVTHRPTPGPQAQHTLHQLRPARPHQPGKTEDFAFAQAETGILRITGNVKMLHLKNRLALAAGVPVGIEFRHIAPHHQPRHIGRLQLRGRVRGDQPAVAQHGYAVGDFLHFRQAVRDIEHGHAFRANIADDVKQRLGFDRRQAGRRFVKNDQPMRHEQHAHDLHQLPLGDRQAADDGVGVYHAAQFGDRPAGAVAHGTIVHYRALAQFAAKVDVLRHRQIRREQYFLMDEHNAAMFGIHRPAQRDGVAVDTDLTARGLFIARQQFHERRLAGAVLTDDGMHLAGPHVYLYVLQNLNRSERFR